uniref:Uncharacterized protein n=1 Tax=Romanomermis culicivorax TaxID=13658 RepID=A0A915IKG1_ROMCU
MNFYPTRRRCDILAPVIGTPALHETDSNGTHTSQCVNAFETVLDAIRTLNENSRITQTFGVNFATNIFAMYYNCFLAEKNTFFPKDLFAIWRKTIFSPTKQFGEKNRSEKYLNYYSHLLYHQKKISGHRDRQGSFDNYVCKEECYLLCLPTCFRASTTAGERLTFAKRPKQKRSALDGSQKPSTVKEG